MQAAWKLHRCVADTPDFPRIYKAEHWQHATSLTHCEMKRTRLDVPLPIGALLPEKRTGKSRLGGNQLLVAENNESKSSMEHFAVALVDELERLTHSRQRLTVGY